MLYSPASLFSVSHPDPALQNFRGFERGTPHSSIDGTDRHGVPAYLRGVTNTGGCPLSCDTVPKNGARKRKSKASGTPETTDRRGTMEARPDLPHRFHVAEVAESFGVSARTVRSWIEKGLLEREKVGNSVFIRSDQIDAMLARSKRKKKP